MSKRISLDTIDHDLDGGNMSGIVPRVIYGYWEDVAAWPTEPKPTELAGVVTPMTLEQAGALVGDVVMKSGTKAFNFDFTEDVGSLKINSVGETDAAHVEYDLSLTKAKIAKKILGFQNAALERKMFFIVQDENENYYLMGNKRRGCTYVTGGDGNTTGATSSDRNQSVVNFKFRAAKGYVYEGDVEDILVQVP